MSDRIARTIAIVGSGFSGTATAIHLLRQAGGRSMRVILIERGAEFGRGLAYARTDYPFLLNVPAARMSATASDPDEFLRFARLRDPAAGREDFLPRSLYGEYLQDLLERAAAKAAPTAQLDRVHGEAVDVACTDGGRRVRLQLADGRTADAQEVVLALGTPLPRIAAASGLTAGSTALRTSPWSRGKPLDGRSPLLVIGTGLTMVDVVCAALDSHPGVEIHAISRRGLLPPSQTAFRPDALDGDGGLLASSAGSTARLVRAARRLAREAEQCGGDWREVVTLLRREAPALWSTLPGPERARFLRHARSYWEIHRHRVPAAVLSRVEAALATDRLSVHAGRLQSLEPIENGVRATWIARGSYRHRVLDVAEVVDCSGPDYDVTRSPDRLWQALLGKGMAVPDELMLGIRTGPRGALVGGDGSISARVFYIGPHLRADHWESTAVAELRTHAEQLANFLSALPG